MPLEGFSGLMKLATGAAQANGTTGCATQHDIRGIRSGGGRGSPKRPMPGARCVFLGQVFQDRAQSVLVGVLGVGTR